jgi:catechol-2,3-dioxygenase
VKKADSTAFFCYTDEEVKKMKYRMIHNKYNVCDLEKSNTFYRDILGFSEVKRRDNPQFTLVFM